MKNVTINLIGLGGIGSFLLAPLSKIMLKGRLGDMRVETLILTDGDTYQSNNRERQFYPSICEGMNKAEAQRTVLETMYPVRAVDVVSRPSFVTTPDEALTAFRYARSETNIVIAAVDNHACRALLASALRTLKPHAFCDYVLINGANEMVDGNVNVQGSWNGFPIGADLLERHPEIAHDQSGSREGLSCLDLYNLEGGEQTMEANMWAAMLIYSVLLRLAENDWTRDMNEIYFDTNPPRVRTDIRGKEEEDEQSLD